MLTTCTTATIPEVKCSVEKTNSLSISFFFSDVCCHLAVMKEERDNLVNPYWLEDKALTRGAVDFLTGSEIQFWKDMIEKYLYPIDEDKAEQVC